MKGLLGASLSCRDINWLLVSPLSAQDRMACSLGSPTQLSIHRTGWPPETSTHPFPRWIDSSAPPNCAQCHLASGDRCLSLSSLDRTAEPTTRYPAPHAPQGPQLTQAAGAEAVVGPRLGLGLVAVKDLLHQLLH